ncbi:unnamed protein product [Ceutorhynchus assimilis]|uniref:Titin n=1 Tax=Ceutorhynchus assimilis TaxID=467358 RepID=A0A9P0GK89_9CUCU|nr:unnamed protein product [Ceutorhynchus assimilis]
MGNANVKPYPRVRNKKQVHWKAAGACFGKGVASFDIDRPAPPGKPELLPETEGTPDLVTLRWSRPINDGGSPVSGYLVEHRRVGSPHWVRATPLPVLFPEITLSGLEPGWRYQFRISAENAVGYSDPSEVSEPITVTLHRSAVTAPKFTQEVADTVALENEKCEFVVHFLGQPAPRVSWFKDGFEIFSSRRIRILTEHDRSILTIHQTSLSDEGEIKCTATNRAGHVSSKAKLTVEAPPNIRLPRNYEDGLLFELGETIRLKVSVVGRPTPLVFWHHNGESIQNTDRCKIDYSDNSFALKIANAQRSDRGEYQIKAVNKLGTDTTSFLVTVTDKPSPPVPSVPGKARVVMTLGRSVTLSWTSPNDDGGCKIGNYIIEYYRLGWNVWLKAATSRQLTTRLGDLIEGSEYKFRIKAESPYGVSDPSEESEIVFIPDPKRGLNKPLKRDSDQDFFEEITSPKPIRRKRSQSTSKVPAYNANTEEIPPMRPKRTKSKSQQQTPDTSPMLPRKDVVSKLNQHIFDRASLARDLAYGSPDLKLQETSKASYKVTIQAPKEQPTPAIVEPQLSPERKNKLIREHSGSSEFMLVLYSDENNQDEKDLILNFDVDPVPPPLSLSAPELSCLEQPQFPPLKYSSSSTELLHERAMIRFYEDAEAEDKLLEEKKSIPKIQINNRESDDIVGLDRRHSLRRKFSSGGVAKWAQKRYSLKNPSDLKQDLLSNTTNLKKSPLSAKMKREIMMLNEQSTSEELTDQEFEKQKKVYSQSSFENRPVTSTEELEWNKEYEESLSESESESEDLEKFKYEVSKGKKVHLNKGFNEESTYRPAGGLSGMVITNEPFEILNKRKELPDPNFIPKPILKKTDSPQNISPLISPPQSPTRVSRALSPRPDVVLQRDRAKSLAIPMLSPLVSSGDESDEPKKPRVRSLSLTAAQNVLLPSSLLKKKNNEKLPTKIDLPKSRNSGTLPNISIMAQITGIAAASIVIPKNLLDKKKDDEEVKVVADHYDHIVRTVGQKRRASNPFLNRDELKKAAENFEDGKEQTPSKENLSQDSGYQSISGYRFNDYYETGSKNNNDGRKSLEELHQNDENTSNQQLFYYRRGSSIRVAQQTPMDNKNNPEKLLEGESSVGIQTTSSVLPLRRESDAGFQRTTPLEGKNSHITPRRDSGVGYQSLALTRDIQKNPLEPRRSTEIQRGRAASQSKGRRSVSRSKSPSKRGPSVSRRPPFDESSSRPKKSSPSPLSATRKPMLKEITTQTSGYLESFDLTDKQFQDQLLARAEVQVRSAVDWLTDLAMFAVACWLYLFENELLAIPVLLIMVYRQLKEEIRKRIPVWLLRKLQRRNPEKKM